jgi:amino acid adenylation domain-containing protein
MPESMTHTSVTKEKRKQLLEAYFQTRPEAARQAPRRVAKGTAESAEPLTSAQKQLWLHAQLAPDTPLYNEPLTVRRVGALDKSALERSLTEIVRRHEAWRTVFPVIQGQAMQVVQAPFEVSLPLVDLRSLPQAERAEAAHRVVGNDAQLPFDLAKGPLFRATLVHLDDEEHLLFVTLHHLIFDGFSGYRIFLPELTTLYEAFSHGEPSPLPELDFQFADYTLWEQEWQRGHEFEDRIRYWKRQLAEAPPALELPIARTRPAVQGFDGAMHSLKMPASLSEELRRLSRQAGATLFMTLLASFNALLHRYSGQDDILIGSNTAGRNCPGSEKLLGYFLNTVVLRSDLSGDPTFRQLLERVRQVTLDALAHDGVPLDRLVAEIQPRRDPNRNPFFQVLFSLEPPLSSSKPGWDLTCIDVETGTSKFELCLVLDDRPDGLLCRFIYSTAWFDESTIVRMAGHWQTLLEAVVADPGRKISEFPLLTQAERNQVLVEWNETATPKPQACVDELFAVQAQRTPHAVAVKCGKRQLSYKELEKQADKLSHLLRSMGVGPDQAVAICAERSVEMIVAILAVLKAGGAYVPLDPAYPTERLELMLADCQASALLIQSHLASSRLFRRIRTILLDSEQWQKTTFETSEPQSTIQFDNLAYIMYTSGSTGAPKGVPVTHGNLAHSNQARLKYYKDPVASFLLLSSYAFDSSIAGIFHSLATGGTLVIPAPEFRWQPEEIVRLIAENQITHTLTFPSLYSELLDHADPSQIASLQTVMVAGEACPRQLVNDHYRILPQTALFNEYGPTEAAVWSSVYECEPGESDGTVPIGRPIANTQLYVLDRNGEPVPALVPGELYVGGDGVTPGYWDRPDLTEAAFVSNPFSGDPVATDPAAKLYRTGDMVRYLPDGNLEFLGRRDQQVKIRGLRIELGEVEAILAQHPDVREAVVVTHSNGSGEPQLAAYVATREEFNTSSNELRIFLKRRLPNYMVPSAFHLRRALPRTANGKVDRSRLLLSESVLADVAPAPICVPKNDVEKRLLAIWQRVLKTDSQDVTQDFFAMGGHSLLAAQLLAGIEKEFGRPLSLAFVFQAPTIEQMAESLSQAGKSLRDRAIVPIQPNGTKPPLFWIRGGPRFRLLAQKLGLDQPFFGLDLPYTDSSKLPVPYRFEDIAELLVQALQEAQPRGPYFLAGLCVNAVLAYEVARQLLQRGEEVALLALFDGHNQAYYKNPFTDGRYSGRIKYHLSNLLHLDARETPAYLLDRLDEARRKIQRLAWQLTTDRNAGATGNTDDIVHPAFHRYDPKPYPAKMVLLQSSAWPEGPYFDFRLGWEHLVSSGIEFHWMPGDHPSMFTEPNVNLVAEKLRVHLGQSASVADLAP